jgi:hypothetical protein
MTAETNPLLQHPMIYAALAKCLAEIGEHGIGKNKRNSDQGFNFRGIDDVYNYMNPIFAKHGVVPVPRYFERVVDKRLTAKGKDMYNVTVRGTVTFYAADGSHVIAEAFGESQDTADKATNKSMSAAYKYACFQVLCIPTAETAQDGDNDPKEETVSYLTEEQIAGIRAQMEELKINEQLFCQSIKVEKLGDVLGTQLADVQKLLDKKRAKLAAEAAEPATEKPAKAGKQKAAPANDDNAQERA